MARNTWSNYFVLFIVVACFVVIALDRAGGAPSLRRLTTLLYNWTVLLAGFALLLGVANVFLVHLRRIYTGQPGWTASMGLLVALFAVFVAGLVDPRGAASPLVEWLFDSIIAPGQATLFALLAFFMAAAAYRYLRIGRTGGAWMLAGTLLMLVAQLPVAASSLPDSFKLAMDWLLMQPVMAVMRGALLGSGLALVIVGLRFLLGRNEVG